MVHDGPRRGLCDSLCVFLPGILNWNWDIELSGFKKIVFTFLKAFIFIFDTEQLSPGFYTTKNYISNFFLYFQSSDKRPEVV